MVFFSHWIANCCCTQQPLYLISAAADGSGLWQLHFPYRSMAAYADHRWLWIFDAAVFFSLKHIIYTARASAVLFTEICRSNEGVRRGDCELYYRAACLIKRTKRKEGGKKAGPTTAVCWKKISAEFSQLCWDITERGSGRIFIARHQLILNLLLLRASASTPRIFLEEYKRKRLWQEFPRRIGKNLGRQNTISRTSLGLISVSTTKLNPKFELD